MIPLEEAKKLGILINIYMRDAYRSIGAGQRVVVYRGHKAGFLYIYDWDGGKSKIPDKLYKFLGVTYYATEIADTGEITITKDKETVKLGRLFGDNPPKEMVKKQKKQPKKTTKKRPKKAAKKKKKFTYSGDLI
jgi:hypothetical protein